MTEPTTTYETEREYTEREVQRECVKALRQAGALVIVTSQDRRTRRQLKGFPDVLVFWHGFTVCMELKRPGEGLRSSQQDFWNNLRPHWGQHLGHLTVSSFAEMRGGLWSLGLYELADALEGE